MSMFAIRRAAVALIFIVFAVVFGVDFLFGGLEPGEGDRLYGAGAMFLVWFVFCVVDTNLANRKMARR